ncbi:MAG: response regulator, partial [Gammaproteobacteria bacterium]|nr:response regulator [Gammaproteobacteria bacterium]
MGINKQQTILTVDDNARNLDLLDGFLRKGNYNIIRAENGEKALELSRNNDIDLVLLDIMMPGLDGYQVCEELKKMPEYASVPVIFLTAKHDVESMVKGFNVGAVDYLIKPINVEEFNARVNTHLRLRRKELELKQYDAAKNRFIANIAEDLLSPIESLRSVLKMLNDSSGTLEKELMQDYISLAYSASDCLDAISQNLKQWSALQNN